MFSITDLKKGVLIDLDGKPYRVVEYSQKVMGRGGSIVNVKLKNIIDGSTLAKTMKGNEKIAPADVSMIKVQYLYDDGGTYHFMDESTYDQFELSEEVIGDSGAFLKEGMTVQAQKYDGNIVGIELPIKVDYSVTEADPGIKGDTVSNVMKSATIETGARVQVPLFVNVGDRIVIDTRNGNYVERAK